MITLVLSVAIFMLTIVLVYMMNGEVARPNEDQPQAKESETEDVYDE